jgi:hypothetical protein
MVPGRRSPGTVAPYEAVEPGAPMEQLEMNKLAFILCGRWKLPAQVYVEPQTK